MSHNRRPSIVTAHSGPSSSQYSLHTPIEPEPDARFASPPSIPHQYRQQASQPYIHPAPSYAPNPPASPPPPPQPPIQQFHQHYHQPDPPDHRYSSPPPPHHNHRYSSNPHTPRYSSPSPAAMSGPPESYQMQPQQLPQYQQPPQPSMSPPPNPHAPPAHPQQYPPPPQQYPEGPASYNNPPPPPPDPIHTSSISTGPKTPVYTPGGGAGPNGGIHAPGQIGHPNQRVGPEPYHYGMCDCFSDFGTCCLGCWCPCMLYARTHHRLKTVPASNLNEYKSCNAHCALWCVLSPVSWIFTTLQKSRIRENYRLQGSVAGDCARAYCCAMCTLVQDDREVAFREDERRRFAGPGSGVVGDAGYRRASGMTYG